MKTYIALVYLVFALAFTLNASAKDNLNIHISLDKTTTSTKFSKASRDTHYLLGGPTHNADHNGTFQDSCGAPNWNGFVTKDCQAITESHWHVSDFLPLVGNYSAWCGVSFGATNGYGNGWNELIEYVFEVSNPAEPATVGVIAIVSYNTEVGYDYSYLSCYKDGGVTENLWRVDDTGSSVMVDTFATYQPDEYRNGNEIRLAWRLFSDGAWSTEDGLWPGDGGLWVDNCAVTVTNDGISSTVYDDFETGTLGNWAVAYPLSVGDFSKIWTHLEDVDPCLAYYGPQVAFIDDGLVVPGTGGNLCDNWCYGPGGYIINTSGGLLGAEGILFGRLENAVMSPVMEWPDQSYDGCQYLFDVYRHENMRNNLCTSFFYQWAVRSVTGSDPSAIESAIWRDRNFVYYGGPEYIRDGDTEISNLFEPGRTFVQVRVSVVQYTYCWAWEETLDASPAPYFDNIRLLAYPFVGPGFSYRQLELAQDNFPAHGSINYDDLGSNSVRFDMASSISPRDDMFLNPGDSIIVDISPARAGATLDNLPIIHYTIDANPLFDDYRTSPTTGSASADVVTQLFGSLIDTIEGKYAFDLPDEGLLFPGDVLHYYISAEDAIGGSAVQGITIPRDISEFGDFSDPMKYHSEFTVHALPTISQDGDSFTVPEILFWNDFGDRGGEDKWYITLANLGLVRGVDYDIYFTQAPTSGVSNGLGGRATLDQIRDYGTILYSSGDLSSTTMSNGDLSRDLGNDAALIIDWLGEGNKNLLATGDGLASDLYQAGDTTMELASEWMGLEYLTTDVHPFIGSQAAPLVRRIGSIEENPVFKTAGSWIAYGSCPGINTFDGLETKATAVRLAEFTDPSGGGGAYPYSAVTLNVNDVVGSRVITMPYDFLNIWTDPDAAVRLSSLATRVHVMNDILNYFGIVVHSGTPTSAPDVVALSASNYPNPFNPSTKIEFLMPRTGHLSLKVFNLRGELVRTLVDDVVEAGYGFRMWNGVNEQGAEVSSGVYFYETRTGAEVKVNKMALVK